MQIKNVFIPLDSFQIQADLYINNNGLPFVIMAHGLGGDKSCALDRYIKSYLEQGYSVCCFDHRGFGKSSGKYKNLVDKNSQLKDWKAVIQYLKNEFNLTEQDFVLWGYSFSGGHVLTLASEQKYHAVIANFPHVDGLASLLGYPKRYLLPATYLAITDLFYSLFGKSKLMKIVAKSRFAVLSGSDCYRGYYSLVEENQNWDNQVPARIVLTIPFYRPISVSHKIQTPTLMIGAKQDSLIPISSTRKTAQQSKSICYLEEDCGHFDLFHAPYIDRIQSQHISFLQQL
ncbi:alpha/beta hydrolase [Acinetobacter sp. GFQ9D192M]|uniref:alpha/beta hydrolase n=1 Tax=unclassified Acinetobacter TaxID=196816 RepID=UPI00140A8E26|nr:MULTISPECIES: alpha/beta fold hydrolase [unclassified Acinetobacter]NHB64106.1 alpha/beta hydrolase [Acinetobacter sp. GFQ9D191M]NHC00593.1 alpha/beta hydrolase [Acinetobacter sp. GFQ9D192M]